MKMKNLDSRRGSALTMIVLLLLFASILATATIGVALGENQLSMADEKTMQNYYTARSVTEVTARKLSELADNLEQFYLMVPEDSAASPITSTGVTTSGISYDVSIWRGGVVASGDNEIFVKTTAYRLGPDGTSKDYTASASKVLYESGSGFFENAIYSRTLLETQGGSGNPRQINGDIVYEGIITGVFNMLGGHSIAKNPKKFNFKPIYAPGNVTYAQTIEDGTWGGSTIITENTEYTGTLTMTANHSTITFQNPATGPAPDSIYVTINTLDLSHTSNPTLTFDATGVNRVLLYFNGPIIPFDDPDTSKKITLEVLSSSTSPSVFVAINTAANLYMDGKQILQCYIYAPTSLLSFGGTSNDITGAILADTVMIHGGINIVYPQDTNIFSNNYEYIATTVTPHLIADEKWLPRN